MQSTRIIMARRYDSAVARRRHVSKERRAVYYEISYYISGNGSVTINGIEHPIKPGYVRFVRPGDLIFSTVPFSCLTVNFEFFGEAELESEQLFQNIPRYFTARQDTADLMNRIIDITDNESAEDRLMKYSLFYRLLSTLCHYSAAPHYNSAVESSIRYMKENLDAHITLNELGARAGYSALHFRRLFITATGLTPHDYLFELRFNRAKELLSQTGLTIDRISAACGFRSSANFKTMFKKRMNITPGKFRKEMNDIS